MILYQRRIAPGKAKEQVFRVALAWGHALEGCGFFKGPSNFIFAASKKYAEALHPFAENCGAFHITRADGDGLPRNF